MKTSFWSIFCFLYQIFVNFWRQKNPNSKMVHRRKISTTEVRGNKRFFYTQSGVGFWFRPLFGKMVAAPPSWSTFREKIFIWVNSVIIHSLKNIFKVPGGICWQFFPGKMRSEIHKIFLKKWSKSWNFQNETPESSQTSKNLFMHSFWRFPWANDLSKSFYWVFIVRLSL